MLFRSKTLNYKITASRIKWNPETKNYTMYDVTKRKVGLLNDILEKSDKKDTIFTFDLEDLTPVVYIAETLPLHKLIQFIDKEKARGNANINVYLVVLYKKYSTPVSAFILTILAVSVSAMKRRGGMGMNLTIGILLAFGFVFFEKVFSVLAEKSSIPPFVSVWVPNIIFGVIAFFTLRNARK